MSPAAFPMASFAATPSATSIPTTPPSITNSPWTKEALFGLIGLPLVVLVPCMSWIFKKKWDTRSRKRRSSSSSSSRSSRSSGSDEEDGMLLRWNRFYEVNRKGNNTIIVLR
ncbi:hypothetical protein ACJBU6_04397 [Exserohilum turcicum]